MLFKYDIVCLAEHLLNVNNSPMLEVSSDHLFFIRPAKTTNGRPSGGLLVAVDKKFRCSCFES